MATMVYERDGLLVVVPMGGGKTATGLTAIRDLIDDGHIRSSLVIAPKRVVESVWPQEPKLWSHLQWLKVVPLVGNQTQRAELLKQHADVYLCSFDNLKWLATWLHVMPKSHPIFDLLLIDEMSKLKNPYSKWLKTLMKLRPKFRQMHGMTGTPRPNGFEDLFGPLRLLSNRAIWSKSFQDWRTAHFMPLDYNGYKWGMRPEHEARLTADAAKYMTVISKDELAKLPEIVTVEHRVTLPEAVMREYKRMENQLVADLDEGKVVAASAGVANGKCAQIAQGYLYGEGGAEDVSPMHPLKFDKLSELIDGLDDEPALIVYGFKEDLRRLREMRPGIPFLGSGVPSAIALQHEADWNAGRLPLLALHPASAAHGLNLQKGGRHVIWLCPTWSPELYEQTIARIHRQGQTEKCYNHLIIADKTLDEAKLLRCRDKLSEQEAFARYLHRV